MQHLVVIAGNLRCDHPGTRGRLCQALQTARSFYPNITTFLRDLYDLLSPLCHTPQREDG
jgi:hypothetical protein